MKTKAEITANWLPRYTGVAVDEMSDYVLLTNFNEYLHRFVAMTGGHIVDANRSMPSAQGQGMTLINFGMGSPNAATVCDLLSVVQPKAILFWANAEGCASEPRWATSSSPSAQSAEKGPQTPTFPLKCLPCLHSCCSAPPRT